MKKISVTGATGFVGRRWVVYNQDKFQLQTINLRNAMVKDIDLRGADAVVHLAGKAHEMKPIADDIYFAVNYELTKQLADTAKAHGVPQFVYISSVKVYGDTLQDVLDESSPCVPTDAYGASKLKAEQYLRSIETDSFRVAIVRPPLVYGPGVKGNMIRLLQMAEKNIPLPFGGIRNQRSMVFVDNLAELINTIIDRKASGIFIAGDNEPVSTSNLLMMMRAAMDNRSKLVSVPLFLRKIIQLLRPGLYLRLFGSFVVDNRPTNNFLNFTPPCSTAFGIQQMVKWFKETQPSQNK